MAIPKTLKPISKDKALALIAKHEKAGTGSWEGSPNCSDFVYEGRMTKWGRRHEMIRPGYEWETGVVSM